MEVRTSLTAMQSGGALDYAPIDAPAEKVKPLSGTVLVVRGNNSAIDPESSGQSVYERKVSIDRQPPSNCEEITINDPEFNPPVKLKKLALAIKIFCKSFKEMRQVNNPEADRSAKAESIRNRFFTAAYTFFNALSCAAGLPILFALGSGIFIGLALLAPLNAALSVIPAVVAIIALGVGINYVGCKLATAIASFITTVVSALVDTREKLAEMTASTSSKEKFLNKFQRMEESLDALRIKLAAAEVARYDKIVEVGPTKHERYTNPDFSEAEFYRIEELRQILNNDKLYDVFQRYCLRNYEGSIDNLNDAISKIEDWLVRASKQKALLSKEQQGLNVEATSRKPDAERMTVSGGNGRILV